MKPLALALLSLAIAGGAGAADVVALGVGAVAPGEAVVKIDGRDVHLRVEGVRASGDPNATTFLRCLVAGRVVRVKKTSATAARLTMLDGTVVSEQVNEFLDTRSSVDPCTLGKGAYQPQPIAVAATATATRATAATSAEAPAREGHVSFGSSGAGKFQPARPVETAQQPPARVPPPNRPAEEVPAVQRPTAAEVYTPQAAPVQRTLPTSGTATYGQAQTTTIGTSNGDPLTTVKPETPPVTQQKPPQR